MQNALAQTIDDAGQLAARHRPACMATLPVGDYLWELVPREPDGSEDGDDDTLLASMAVERKRISDLVGRSFEGDHLRQTVVLRGLGLDHSFLLVEGLPKSARTNR
eukprot:413233-Rhodomonas_salina.2